MLMLNSDDVESGGFILTNKPSNISNIPDDTLKYTQRRTKMNEVELQNHRRKMIKMAYGEGRVILSAPKHVIGLKFKVDENPSWNHDDFIYSVRPEATNTEEGLDRLYEIYKNGGDIETYDEETDGWRNMIPYTDISKIYGCVSRSRLGMDNKQMWRAVSAVEETRIF